MSRDPQDIIRSLQDQNLQQATLIKQMREREEAMGDALMIAGSDADSIRDYFPDYMTPDERLERDQAHAATRPVSAIQQAKKRRAG